MKVVTVSSSTSSSIGNEDLCAASTSQLREEDTPQDEESTLPAPPTPAAPESKLMEYEYVV